MRQIRTTTDAGLAARLKEMSMTPYERQHALHALAVGTWLADLLLDATARVRGLRRALIARRLRAKRASRRQASAAATRRPARA